MVGIKEQPQAWKPSNSSLHVLDKHQEQKPHDQVKIYMHLAEPGGIRRQWNLLPSLQVATLVPGGSAQAHICQGPALYKRIVSVLSFVGTDSNASGSTIKLHHFRARRELRESQDSQSST